MRASQASNPVTVLVVDDIQQVRHELRQILPLLGPLIVVGEAADGLGAVSQAEALQPQVVLMDLEMPVLDGYEAARRILARCPGCRVVALSIHDSASARVRAAQAGIQAFVAKGAPLELLAQALLGSPPEPDLCL